MTTITTTAVERPGKETPAARILVAKNYQGLRAAATPPDDKGATRLRMGRRLVFPPQFLLTLTGRSVR